jgi:chromosomal replication initiation ATPase DnaA
LARQLVLDLGHRPALGRDDFLVTPSNQAAVSLVDQWPQWPSHAAVLVGPEGSGKTHLAEVWRMRSGADSVAASDLLIDQVPQHFSHNALVIEAIDMDGVSEALLFHAFNHAKQADAQLLFTSQTWPLNIQLPDLKSRLGSLPTAAIQSPDDALLRGVLVKLFNDRQIAVHEASISYLVTRMPRSLAVARLLVDKIDVAALEQRADVTRNFVAKILAEMENPDLL